jgi:ribonuclease-3
MAKKKAHRSPGKPAQAAKHAAPHTNAHRPSPRPSPDTSVTKLLPADSLVLRSFAGLEAVLGHNFTDTGLLRLALTHSSVKTDSDPSNERMEFFGDAVLGLVVTEMLYRRFPEYPEGELTRLKSLLVSRESLAEKAIFLRMHDHVLIGRGVGARESLPKSILSNIFEAVLAALYLDAGYAACERFLHDCFREDVEALIGRMSGRNYKSALQQLAQARLNATPAYKVVSESGPDHNKRFAVAAAIQGVSHGVGEGASKKEAEQVAARIALRSLLSKLDLGDDDAAMLMELPVDDEDDDGDDEPTGSDAERE